jgi:hypothetical protein
MAYDIVDPSSPVELSVIQNGAIGLAIDSGHAYVAASRYDGGSLIVIDISDPHSPVTRGSVDLPDSARTVAVEGAYAYVTVLGDGLRLVNVNSPTNPVVVGHFPADGAVDAAVADGYAYVGSTDGLHIVDVTNPSFPVEVGLHPVGGRVTSVDVSRPYAYIGLDSHSDRIHALDISDPANPILVGALSTFEKAGMPEQIQVVGDRVYTAHWTDGWSISYGCHALFVDGFESGDASAWSLSAP